MFEYFSIFFVISVINAQQLCPVVLDLVILLDSSGSIEPYQFEFVKNSLAKLFDKLYLDKQEVYAGLINFSDNSSLIQFYIPNDEYKFMFQKQIKSSAYFGRSSSLETALEFSRNKLFSIDKGSLTPKILLLFSDAKSNEPIGQIVNEVDQLKAAGVHVFVIGLGKYLDNDALDLISSKPLETYRFDLENFISLQKKINNITSTVCSSEVFID